MIAITQLQSHNQMMHRHIPAEQRQLDAVAVAAFAKIRMCATERAKPV
jgi:hypothetical protein